MQLEKSFMERSPTFCPGNSQPFPNYCVSFSPTSLSFSISLTCCAPSTQNCGYYLLLGLWQLPWECQQEICFQLDIMRKMKFAGTEMCVVPCSALVLLWESCLISLRFNFLLYKVGVVIITLTFGVVSRIQENIFENVIYKLFIIWQMLDFTFSVRACGNTVSQTTYCFSGLHPYVSIFHPHQHELGPFQMIPTQKRPGLVKLPGTRWHRHGCPALQISNVGAASASHPQEMRKEGPAPQHTVNTWHTFLE